MHAALAAVGTRQGVDVMEMGGGPEEGDQVVIGGVPTRPSSASTSGHSNNWEVNTVRHKTKNFKGQKKGKRTSRR